jgi:protein arginine kinase activator
MKCQSCHNNPAVVHLVKMVNGLKSEMHLCVKCAAKFTSQLEESLELNKVLGELLAQLEETESQQKPAEIKDVFSDETALRCPDCGIDETTVKNDLLLGCENDYFVFTEFVGKMLARFQDGNTTHKGKIPNNLDSKLDRKPLIVYLKQQLADAVELEEYELAADLRDRIDSLTCS